MSTSQGVNVRPRRALAIHREAQQPSERCYTDKYQVLRYSALIFGIAYGFQHQRTITSNAKIQHAQKEYQHKADLIQKAKAEWAKKSLPPESKTAGGDGMPTLHQLSNGKLTAIP